MWNVIKMALKLLFFAAKSQILLSGWGSALRPLSTVTKYSETTPRLWHTWATSICSARGINQAILEQKKTFGSYLLRKIMVVRLVAFTAAGRRQDSVTGGGAEINFVGHENFIYVNSRGARGHEKFILVWIKQKRSSVQKFSQILVIVSKFLRFFTNS